MSQKTIDFASVEEVFKYALLVERRGYEFYCSARERTDNKVASEFYDDLAKEEQDHIRILNELYKTWKAEANWDKSVFDSAGPNMHVVEPVFKEAFKKSLGFDNYDMAALDVAIILERDARDFYTEAAEKVEDQKLAEVLRWLTKFEEGHYNSLVDLQQSMRDDYWHDNNFWPF
jgi:rubrerythrin